jgi:DNA (cytosine-5)-methyltransferase 1
VNELHLFAGAGGGILGGMLLGHTCVCAVEINEYARRVLLQRQRDGILPRFPIWDDIRGFDPKPLKGKAHVVCGGFPCQRFSKATRGRANAEDLWPEMLRVVAGTEPDFVFAENVSKRAIEIAGEDLRKLGYASKAIPLSASDVGADHIRKRYWLLAYSDMRSQLRKRNDAKAPLLPLLRSGFWSTYTDESRMVDGMADRMDRIKATGNGQVPIVAATAWKALRDTL